MGKAKRLRKAKNKYWVNPVVYKQRSKKSRKADNIKKMSCGNVKFLCTNRVLTIETLCRVCIKSELRERLLWT